MSNTPPAGTLRDGNLKATIWKNEGEKGPYFSTTFSRSYRDEEGNYRDTDSFSSADLLRVSELARQAHHEARSLWRELSQERGQNRDQARVEERLQQNRSQSRDMGRER